MIVMRKPIRKQKFSERIWRFFRGRGVQGSAKFFKPSGATIIALLMLAVLGATYPEAGWAWLESGKTAQSGATTVTETYTPPAPASTPTPETGNPIPQETDVPQMTNGSNDSTGYTDPTYENNYTATQEQYSYQNGQSTTGGHQHQDHAGTPTQLRDETPTQVVPSSTTPASPPPAFPFNVPLPNIPGIPQPQANPAPPTSPTAR